MVSMITIYDKGQYDNCFGDDDHDYDDDVIGNDDDNVDDDGGCCIIMLMMSKINSIIQILQALIHVTLH